LTRNIPAKRFEANNNGDCGARQQAAEGKNGFLGSLVYHKELLCKIQTKREIIVGLYAVYCLF
jgi:hypothetical protein